MRPVVRGIPLSLPLPGTWLVFLGIAIDMGIDIAIAIDMGIGDVRSSISADKSDVRTAPAALEDEAAEANGTGAAEASQAEAVEAEAGAALRFRPAPPSILPPPPFWTLPPLLMMPTDDVGCRLER